MPIEFNPTDIAAYYRTRCPGVKQTKGKDWRGACPVHHGTRESFSVDSTTGQAYCHSDCGRGWDIISLEQELSHCDFRAAKESVFRLLGKQDESTPKMVKPRGKLDRIYDYEDEQGEILYQIVRYKDPKTFSQRRPDGNGDYIYSIKGIRRVPYHLTEVLKSNFVFVVEGEKDVDNLRQLGIVATCNNGGAGNFSEELAPHFAGKSVAILPDNDEPGRDHAQKVAELL
jgi:DNA primase